MVCLMGLSSHLLSASVIGRYGNEMRLVETLVEQVPDTLTVRLIRHRVNGVERQVATSMTEAMRYPAADIAELY